MSSTDQNLRATDYPNPARLLATVRRAARRFDAIYDWNQALFGVSIGVIAAAVVIALLTPNYSSAPMSGLDRNKLFPSSNFVALGSLVR